MVIIDTNVFQKLYGYAKEHKNNDKKVDLEKLYEYCFNSKNTICIPLFCVYEIATKQFYKDKLNEIFEFFSLNNIQIINIARGKCEFRQITLSDCLDINYEKTQKALQEQKIGFEKNEMLDNMKEVINILVYILSDYLNIKLAEHNMYSENIIKIISTSLKAQRDSLEKIIAEGLEKVADNEKENLKRFYIDFYKQMILSIYIFLLKTYPELTIIIQKEIESLAKYENSLEYIKRAITQLEKYHRIYYLRVIEKRYIKELVTSGYPKDFAEYGFYIIKKQIYDAKFDKNDFIDNGIFLCSNNKKVITFDKKILGYLENKHKNNYNLICSFYK